MTHSPSPVRMHHRFDDAADAAPYPVASAPAIGLAWLVRWRWVFLVAELLVVLAADPMGIDVEWRIAGPAFALTLLSNLYLASRKRDASPTLLAAAILADGLALTAVLRASGGAMNPFSTLYVVQVALAALVLDRRASALVAGATCIGFGLLFAWTNPHASAVHAHERMTAHLYGMFVAYATTAALVGFFVHRIARSLAGREQEILLLRERTARSERLASLTTLAAGAAHELGTPIGTIAIVATELEQSALARSLDVAKLLDDARLVRAEAERCRRILSRMTAASGRGHGDMPRRVAVDDVIGSVRDALGEPRGDALRVTGDAGAFVVTPREPLVQVLTSLIANGFDAGENDVRLNVRTLAGRVAFDVIDGGRGMDDATLRRLGEPFFSTKPDGGMGLGVFLARSFAAEVGGTLEVETGPRQGTRFTLTMEGGGR